MLSHRRTILAVSVHKHHCCMHSSCQHYRMLHHPTTKPWMAPTTAGPTSKLQVPSGQVYYWHTHQQYMTRAVKHTTISCRPTGYTPCWYQGHMDGWQPGNARSFGHFRPTPDRSKHGMPTASCSMHIIINNASGSPPNPVTP